MRISRLAAFGLLAAGACASAAGIAEAMTRTEKTFGNWKVECTEPDNGPKTCATEFALVNKKTKRVVFSWSVVRSNKEGEVNKAVVRTPTGVLLTAGVNIGFEGADPVRVNYLTCGPNGCVAEFDFTDKWLKALTSNPKVNVNYSSVNEKPIKHEIDLKQFGAAYEFYTGQLADKK